MKTALLDTNVILDVALIREPYFTASSQVFKLIKQGKIEGYITATTVTDIYYLFRKSTNHQTAINFLKKLILIVELIEINKEIIENALNDNFPDFEDGIQIVSSTYKELDFIITRNSKDFKNSPVRAITPSEFTEEIN